jgi:hypothetical protein
VQFSVTTASWSDTDGGIIPLTPMGVHIGRNGVPFGGNFLYEDGHVSWQKFSWINQYQDPVQTIGKGGVSAKYIDYFVPADLNGYGPW